MFRIYLTSFVRNLFRNKAFSFLNILSLTIGITASVMIGLWLLDEISYNKEIVDAENIYQLYEWQTYSDGGSFPTYYCPGPVAGYIQDNYPEVVLAGRNTQIYSNIVISTEEKNFNEKLGSFADNGFLKIMQPTVLAGSIEEALTTKKTIVLTESLAERFYGQNWRKQEIVGSTLKINQTFNYTIDAVIENPKHVSYEGSAFLNFEAIEDIWSWEGYMEWGNNYTMTYLKVNPGTDIAGLGEKVKTIEKDRNEGSVVDFYIKPIKDVYLYSLDGGGRIEYVNIFLAIALVIMLIAIVNFVNLSTARSGLRSKEIGVKKTFGVVKRSLIIQFMLESIFTAIIAAIISVGMIYLLLPFFNGVTGKELTFNPLVFEVGLLILTITLLSGIIAGVYPSFFMSAFRPIEVLKGKVSIKGGSVRKVLVVFQFAISAALMVSGFVIYSQLSHIQNKNLGLNKDAVIYYQLPDGYMEKSGPLKQKMVEMPAVHSTSSSQSLPVRSGMSTSNVQWETKDPDAAINVVFLQVGYDFVETMQMQLADGRDFSKSFASDSSNFVVNQTLADMINPDGAVGESVTMWGENGKVIGVVDDFNYNKVTQNQGPVIIRLNADNGNFFMVKSNDFSEPTMQQFEANWNEVFPELPYEMTFMDQDFQEMYESENRLSKLAFIFSIVSILISSLGLIGLVAFIAEQMEKEIAIRKILGAEIFKLIIHIWSVFGRWIFVANLIGLPVAYFAMERWLEDYQYRIDVSIPLLLTVLILSMALTFILTLYKLVKSVSVNPALKLRNE